MTPALSQALRPSPCRAAQNYLQRTSGLGAQFTQPIIRYLNALTAGALFNPDGTTSFFDTLYIFGNQDPTNALLNVVSASFTCTPNGSPVFTPCLGYAGVDASSTVYLDTGLNPTLGSPKYTQNSAHVSAWSNTNVASGSNGGTVSGIIDLPFYTQLLPKFSDGNSYFRVNDTPGTATAGVANADATGHYLANRSGASAQQGYRNAVDQGVVATTSATPTSGNFYILAVDNLVLPGGWNGSEDQLTMASVGANLNPGNVAVFFNATKALVFDIGRAIAA